MPASSGGRGKSSLAKSGGSRRVVSIGDRAVWNAVRSPLRLQLLEAIHAMGPLTIAQLSGVFGMESTGLYYHIRLLQAAGLVSRVNGSMVETFESRQSSIEIRCSPRNAREAKRASSLTSSLLRECQREFGSVGGRVGLRELVDGLHWENLEASEVAQIKLLQGKIGAILDSARARRAKSTGAGSARANWHIGSFMRSITGNRFPLAPISLSGT